MEWKNIYRGFLMGISDLIPGVSGGTIAFILGIYDRLLLAISGFFSRDWKKHIGFLLPLGIGIGLTLVLFSRVIDFLLKDYPKPTQFFFLGLIIGVVPYIARQAGVRKNFKIGHFLLLLAVGAALASTAFIKPAETSVITSLTMQNTFGLFFAGWLGSMAMLLPGVSGSFILLLLGVYATAINALSTLNLPIIIVIGAGVIVGFIVSSKAIHFLMAKFTHAMFAIIIGLIIGSVFVIYPGIPESGTPFVMSVIALLTGLIVANIFNATSPSTK
ncbi:DUF368 domain-containing protein [Sporosarcina sp. UB5]|uniref:DUF368 domain-containing protein n=1 Tax=Sporosarcina sp. UB5 TaxID=3047463 RepID=UPI003D7B094B